MTQLHDKVNVVLSSIVHFGQIKNLKKHNKTKHLPVTES